MCEELWHRSQEEAIWSIMTALYQHHIHPIYSFFKLFHWLEGWGQWGSTGTSPSHFIWGVWGMERVIGCGIRTYTSTRFTFWWDPHLNIIITRCEHNHSSIPKLRISASNIQIPLYRQCFLVPIELKFKSICCFCCHYLSTETTVNSSEWKTLTILLSGLSSSSLSGYVPWSSDCPLC